MLSGALAMYFVLPRVFDSTFWIWVFNPYFELSFSINSFVVLPGVFDLHFALSWACNPTIVSSGLFESHIVLHGAFGSTYKLSWAFNLSIALSEYKLSMNCYTL